MDAKIGEIDEFSDNYSSMCWIYKEAVQTTVVGLAGKFPKKNFEPKIIREIFKFLYTDI